MSGRQRQVAKPTQHIEHHANRFRDERGLAPVSTALGLGKLALVALLFGTPVVAGASFGAASTAPKAMTGEVTVTQPAKVELLETKIEQEICIANSTVKVSAAMGFEGHPLDQDMEGTILGIPYNLNMEREHSAEVYRKVRYCLKGMDVPYTYDPNIAFGDHTHPAITAEISLSKLIVIVSALHDTRDEYHQTSDGILGYYASELNKYLEQKAVQNLVGKDLAQDANAQDKVDNILRGALDAYIDKEAATRCLQAGESYKWQDSPIGELLTQAGKEAVQQDFLKTNNNRPQPSLSDIALKLVDDITTDTSAQIINQGKNTDMESALNLMTSTTLENGAARELDIAGIKIPISYAINAPTSTAGTCEVTLDDKVSTLTPGDKGEE